MTRNKNTNSGFKIPKDVELMAKTNMKRFKKKNDGCFDGKKEMKRAYYASLLDLLPETIKVLTRYGHFSEIQEIKDDLYEKLVDPDFIKVIRKTVEEGDEIENIKLFPIIYRDMAHRAKMQEIEDKKTDPNAEPYDLSDLTELCQLILKKKLKKLKKEGVDEDIAFDVLCIIPSDKVLEDKQINYKLRVLMAALYEHAKTKDIDFNKIITFLIPKKYASIVILFCLLERKDKFASFNEKQQEFFIQVSGWIFDIMENTMDKDEIESILKMYVNTRKKDASMNRDANRRYFFKSLPGEEYPRVRKIVDKMMEDEPEVEKYF